MSETGIVRTYYDNQKTKLKEEYFEVNGKKEGEYKEYYENGQLLRICNYINEKKEGPYREYHINGALRIFCNYVNNMIKGEYKEYYMDKKVDELREFIGRQFIGIDTIVEYNNMKIKEEYFMINGVKNGKYKEYYNNGVLKKICNYVNGKEEGEYKTYYDNGQLDSIGNMNNSMFVGIFKLYHSNGQLETTCYNL